MDITRSSASHPFHVYTGGVPDPPAINAVLPTPWDQETYDKTILAYEARRREIRARNAPEEEMEALFREIRQKTAPMLRKEKHFGKVGAFQGAAYEAKGLYRPEIDCVMFTRNPVPFCAVCSRAIERVIAMYTE